MLDKPVIVVKTIDNNQLSSSTVKYKRGRVDCLNYTTLVQHSTTASAADGISIMQKVVSVDGTPRKLRSNLLLCITL